MWDTLFKSGKRRSAQQAALAGEWERASQLWLEAGNPSEACAVLLAAAEVERDPQKRLAWLARASLCAPVGSSEKSTVLTKRAQFLLAIAGDGTLDRALRFDLDETAALLVDAAQYDLALTVFQRTENRTGIERALTASGSFEELDYLLREEQANGESARSLRTSLEEAESLILAGDRRGALALLVATKADSSAVTTLVNRLTRGRAQVAPASLKVDGSPKRIWFDALLVIGRGEGQLRLPHAAVSRRHLEITKAGARPIIRDLKTRNGTYVQGLPIAGPMAIEGRLEVALGREAIVVLTPEEDGSLRVEAAGQCAFASFGPYVVDNIGTLQPSSDGQWLELHSPSGVILQNGDGEYQTNPVVTLLSGDTFVRNRGDEPALVVL